MKRWETLFSSCYTYYLTIQKHSRINIQTHTSFNIKYWMDLVFGVSIIIQNCFSVHSLSFLFLSSVLSSVVLAVCVKCLYKFFCKRETSREIPSKVISARERGSDGEWTRERVMTVSSGIRNQTLSKWPICRRIKAIPFITDNMSGS